MSASPHHEDDDKALTAVHLNGHASHGSDDHSPEDSELDIPSSQHSKDLGLVLDDLDDAFSTGDDDVSSFDIAPSVSLQEMAEQEQEDGEGDIEETTSGKEPSTPGKPSFREVVEEYEEEKTPTTASFAIDGMSEIDLASDDGRPAISLDTNGISPPSPDATSPAILATLDTPQHELSPFNNAMPRSPDLSTEFVNVSLESTPGSRRETPPMPTPTTASTVITSTTGSFLSTPTSMSESSAPGSARASHEASESPGAINGSAPHEGQPKPVVPHRQTRHRGPSVLETVISQTRPVYLPPKPKAEDRKHLKDWQSMMAQARATEEKRKHEAELQSLEKERKMEDQLEIWETKVMPDIAAATRDPKLRKLWWDGVPPKLRGRIWAATVGNPLAISKDSYRICTARAKRAMTAGKFPRATLDVIEEDVACTMPSLRIFDAVHGPMHQDLKDLLYAWTVSRGDEGLSYVRGASHVAGMFLINMPIDQAFVAFRNLLDRHCMRSFYAGHNDDVEGYYRIFDTLLADIMPKVYYNFQKHHIPPTRYLPDWIVPVFLLHLPFDACARIWDIMLLEGDSFLFRAALAVMGVMEGRLYFPDHDELMQVLRGEDGTRGKGKEKETVSEGGRYSQYGMTEEAVFERFEIIDEWWKENTWLRLLQRELPDI